MDGWIFSDTVRSNLYCVLRSLVAVKLWFFDLLPFLTVRPCTFHSHVVCPSVRPSVQRAFERYHPRPRTASFPKIGGSQPPPKTPITIISGTHEATFTRSNVYTGILKSNFITSAGRVSINSGFFANVYYGNSLYNRSSSRNGIKEKDVFLTKAYCVSCVHVKQDR